jgi:hypothetical protein
MKMRRTMRGVGPSSRSSRWWLLLGLLLLLARPPASHAPGTQGTLADPISTRQLMDYAERLDLSASQRGALESLHDDYKRNFRILRDGEIAEFMGELHSMQGVMPSKDDVERLFKSISRLQGRIAVLDAQLFDRLGPLLTEEQALALPRVRLARERARYEAQSTMWIGGRPPADVSKAVRALGLSDDALANIDPLLAGYERRVTSEMGKLSKATDRMYLDVFEALEEMGYTDMTQESFQEDPQRGQEMMEAMQSIWMDLSKRITKHAREIGELNDTTYASISAMLASPDASRLRQRYYADAYPELSGVLSHRKPHAIDRVLESDDLDEETRSIVAGALEEHQVKIDRLIDEAVDLVREQRDGFTPFDYGTDAYQEYQMALAELSAKAAELSSAAMMQLNEVLGPERTARVLAAAAESVATTETEFDREATDEPEELIQSWSGDQLVPTRISRRDLKRFGRRLGLDDGQRAIVEELHREYAEAYGALPEIARVRSATQTLWSHDATTGRSTPPSADQLDTLFRARREAFEAIASLDDSFFDDMRTTALREDQHGMLDRVRRLRMRRMYQLSSTTGAYSGMGQSSEGAVDLVDVIESQDLDEEDLASIDALLDEYEAATLDAFRNRYEAQFEVQQASEKWSIVAVEAQNDGTPPAEYMTRYQEIWEAAAKAINDANGRVTDLNRAALDRLATTLPGHLGPTVRRAYNVKAFPNVYNDPASVDAHLRKAQAFADLTPEQRDALADLAAAYLPEYERLAGEMAEISSGNARPFMISGAETDWAEWQRRQSALEQLRFDRDELSLRAVSQLRRTLTEEQVRRLGGLPDPAAHGD